MNFISDKKLSFSKFILESEKTHGNIYDYSISEQDYEGATIPVKIICKIHGVFKQLPTIHKSGSHCPKCALDSRANKRRKTTKEFIEESKSIHGDLYDYSLSDYKGKECKIKIICRIHGKFEQLAYHHSKGSGCPKCSGKNKTTNEIIKEFIEIHGDLYDYSKVAFNGSKNKVKIICLIHGVFEQYISSHKRGQGCPRCKGHGKTTEEFILEAKKIHGDKYSYLKTIYVNSSTKLSIICAKHGLFKQTPSGHLNSKGCQKCVGQNIDFLTYDKAKIHLKPLTLNSKKEYLDYIKKIDINLPKNPEQYYKKTDEWISLGDYFGTGKIANQDRVYVTYNEFKIFSYSLKLKNKDGWSQYIKSNKIPLNIPLAPSIAFKNYGWISWADALGYNIGYEGNWSTNKSKKILTNLEHTDLLSMDPFEINMIIEQGKLPNNFIILSNSEANSEDRIKMIKNLKNEVEMEKVGKVEQDKKTLDFLQKLKSSKYWDDEYDYSNVVYVSTNVKVIIIDKKYNSEHLITPSRLLSRGDKCCCRNAIDKQNYVLKQIKKVHGNTYDYPRFVYYGDKIKSIITCKIHGDFEQVPTRHKQGSGCPTCGGKEQLTQATFEERIKELFDNRYNCSKAKYINNSEKVIIIDTKYNSEHLMIPTELFIGSKCGIKNAIDKTKYVVSLFNEMHGEKYDYSKFIYIDDRDKGIIICKTHGEFKQNANKHLQKRGCPKCANNQISSIETLITRLKLEYDSFNDIDFINSIYKNADTPIEIIYKPYNTKHLISPYNLINNVKCVWSNAVNKDVFLEKKIREIHGDYFIYPNLKIDSIKDIKIPIVCPIHGNFEQLISTHIAGAGCPICNRGWENKHKIDLVNSLEHSDLLSMDPFEIYTIIGQGKIPVDFGTLVNTNADSDGRITTLEELKERFSDENNEGTQSEIDGAEETKVNEELEEIPIDDVDAEITSNFQNKTLLPSINIVADLHSVDNSFYATMDKEAFEGLIQYKIRKIWNNVLNQNITIEAIQNETGGKYFTIIKNLFIEEYKEVSVYKPRAGYSFKYELNLMQKLIVIRLLKNKSYCNLSGTGAGKTLSFIAASREIESRLTLVIVLNSTIKQTCSVIKEVYPDSKIYIHYKNGFVFNRAKNNYLVLNYEKFQQVNSELLFQDLTNNNQIDFVVIDEVHNAKQRNDDEESQRREVLTRLIGRVREKNSDLYTLVMSATPVINNLFEAKSLLQLLTGLSYSDLQTRRTKKNALKIFQQLILNGLRYIPKYDIEINELTGSNMSNLNIDGSHLLDAILELPQSDYIAVEKLLLNDKLKSINPYLRKGVVIYSYLTTGFINEIENYLIQLGFSVGTYTGEESPFIREENLNKFIAGEIDILIGSRPIGTGVDGLQLVCNRVIPITLPWTDSEYTQLKGRFYRQGSIFGSVEIIIPQVRIELGEGDFWSWDVQRLNVIKNKRTLADAAVDGVVPSKVFPTPETMLRKTQESLQNWKNRVNEGNIIDLKRKPIEINLYPDIDNKEQYQNRIQSELSEFNRRGKITKSSTMHKEFIDNPESWRRYHALRKERMCQWDEIPYEYIATKIRNKNHKVIDFGCGENLFKNCIPNNKVISFDHVALDENVIACDIKDVSQWVKNETMDVCVFSLALWGTNYKDYIKEAYRVLNYGGMIHIAEPAKDYETTELEHELRNLIEEVRFKVIGEIERRNKFIYITGIKM